MGTTFLDALSSRVAGLIGKDLLFGATLPMVLIAFFTAAILASVTGLEGWLTAATDLTGTDVAVAAGGLALALLVASYALVALRQLILAFWSGSVQPYPLRPLFALLRRRQQARFDVLANICEQREERFQLYNKLLELGKRSSSADRPLPPEERNRLLELGKSIRKPSDIAATTEQVEQLYNEARALADYYNVADCLEEMQVQTTLATWAEAHPRDERASQAQRDRLFGSADSIFPTELGNLVRASDYYAFHRYNIEGSALGPRLALVLPSEFAERLQNLRVLLDFWLAMATLALVSTLGLALSGPWIHPNPLLWLAVDTAGVFSVWSFYRLAVAAMSELGELMRTTCDLGRFELLKRLGLPEPEDLAHERETWKAAFGHIVYGDMHQLPYRFSRSAMPPTEKG